MYNNYNKEKNKKKIIKIINRKNKKKINKELKQK